MAQSFPWSRVGVEPLDRLLGEQVPRLVTRVAVSACGRLLFGSGLTKRRH